ncbi:hypothetical protein YC2023_016603 [Brassica napus]
MQSYKLFVKIIKRKGKDNITHYIYYFYLYPAHLSFFFLSSPIFFNLCQRVDLLLRNGVKRYLHELVLDSVASLQSFYLVISAADLWGLLPVSDWEFEEVVLLLVMILPIWSRLVCSLPLSSKFVFLIFSSFLLSLPLFI